MLCPRGKQPTRLARARGDGPHIPCREHDNSATGPSPRGRDPRVWSSPTFASSARYRLVAGSSLAGGIAPSMERHATWTSKLHRKKNQRKFIPRIVPEPPSADSRLPTPQHRVHCLSPPPSWRSIQPPLSLQKSRGLTRSTCDLFLCNGPRPLYPLKHRLVRRYINQRQLISNPLLPLL